MLEARTLPATLSPFVAPTLLNTASTAPKPAKHGPKVEPAVTVVETADEGGPIDPEPPTGWEMHAIRNDMIGADGVRLADVNGDGWQDLVTAWSGARSVTICLNPGPPLSHLPWPSIRFSGLDLPEDAVLVDLDDNGQMDVVACTRDAVYIFWAPEHFRDYLRPREWQIQEIPATRGQTWQFCLPVQIDGRNGIDLVIGGKGAGGIVWLEAPGDARDVAAWTAHKISPGRWVMSIVARDMDRDGDLDILLSDRRGPLRGVRWLDNPGVGRPEQQQPWRSYRIGGARREVKFLTTGDLDGDGREDVVVETATDILYLRRLDRTGRHFAIYPIANPYGAGLGKAVRIADIDLDGRLDLVVSFAGVPAGFGVQFLSYGNDPSDYYWGSTPIAGPLGIKYDQIQLLDLDGDGDLDVLTTEQSSALGIIWYENPIH